MKRRGFLAMLGLAPVAASIYPDINEVKIKADKILSENYKRSLTLKNSDGPFMFNEMNGELTISTLFNGKAMKFASIRSKNKKFTAYADRIVIKV